MAKTKAPRVANSEAEGHPYTIGGNYFFRTVTHHHTGKLIAVYDKELVIEQAACESGSGSRSES